MKAAQGLAKRGLDAGCSDAEGRSAVHYAARSGSLQVIQWLKEKGVSVVGMDKVRCCARRKLPSIPAAC